MLAVVISVLVYSLASLEEPTLPGFREPKWMYRVLCYSH